MATTYIHVDANSAGGGNGSTWATSGANAAYTEAELETYLEATVVADTVIWIKEGTYTLDSSWDSSARDGTAISPIMLMGVKAETTNVGANVVYSDWALLAGDKPFMDCSSYEIATGDFCKLYNLSFRGSGNYVLNLASCCWVINCIVENNYGTDSQRYVAYFGYENRIVSCNFTGAHSYGIQTGQYVGFWFCYVHDLTGRSDSMGIYGGDYALVFGCIFDNIEGDAIYCSSARGLNICNCTFYACGNAVSASTAERCFIVNNIVEATTANGFLWTTVTKSNYFNKNHGNDARCVDMWDGVDTTGPWADQNNSNGDPKFTTAGSDFSLQSDSPCLDTGMSTELGV